MSHANNSRLPVLIAATLLLLASAPGATAGVYDTWSKSMRITFSGYSRSGTLTNFPALVVFSNGMASGFSYGDFYQTNQDLRFTDSTLTNPLNYEVESWNTNGSSYVWVQVPSLSSSSANIYAFWGLSGTNAPPCTTNGATWTNAYVAVYHLATTGGVLSAADATGVNNGSVVGNPAATAAQIDGGGSFTSSGRNEIEIPDSASLRITSKIRGCPRDC